MSTGLDLLYTSFRTFAGKSPVWFLYAAALLYLLIRGGREARRIFILPLLVLGITVFNPLLCSFLVSRFGFKERYPRFFWMITYYITLAYAIVLIVSRMRTKSSAVLAGTALTALVVILGRPVFFAEDVPPYRLTPNSSFIREDYPVISSLIHEDGDEMPLILCGSELMMTYRMYDGEVQTLMSRSVLNHLVSFGSAQDFDEKSEASPLLKIIYRVYFYSDYSVPAKKFLYACHKRKIRYIVCKADSTLNGYLEQNEYFLRKGDSGTFAVWKVLLPGEV